MSTLDVSDAFSLPDQGESLALLHHDVNCMQLANTGGVTCPVPDDKLSRLFITNQENATFSTVTGPFCIGRPEGMLLLLTH